MGPFALGSPRSSRTTCSTGLNRDSLPAISGTLQKRHLNGHPRVGCSWCKTDWLPPLRGHAGRVVAALELAGHEVADGLGPGELRLPGHHAVHVLERLLRAERGVYAAEHDLGSAIAETTGDVVRLRDTRGLGGERDQRCLDVVVDGLDVLVHDLEAHAGRRAGGDRLDAE